MNKLRTLLQEAVFTRGSNKYMSRSGKYYKYDTDGKGRKEIDREEYLSALKGKTSTGPVKHKTQPIEPKPWNKERVGYSIQDRDTSTLEEVLMEDTYKFNFKYRGYDDEKTAREINVKRARNLVDRGEFGIRVPEEILGSILNDGRFKSQFETGSSRGYLNPSVRSDFEYDYMGVPQDIEDRKRPIYGMLLDKREFPPLRGRHYGPVVITLKRENLEDRTTITFGDSLDRRAYLLPSEVTDIKPYSIERLLDSKNDDPYHDDISYDYIELQYHGGVSVEDIKEITFRRKPDPFIIDQLESLGIPWSYIRRV